MGLTPALCLLHQLTPLKRCVSLKHNCKKTMPCKVATPLKRCFVQVGLSHRLTDKSMNHNNHMKCFDHCLWYVVWPKQPEFSLVGQDLSRGKNPSNSRAKSCQLMQPFVLVIVSFAMSIVSASSAWVVWLNASSAVATCKLQLALDFRTFHI